MTFPFGTIDHGVEVFFSKFAKTSAVINRLIVSGLGLGSFKLLPTGALSTAVFRVSRPLGAACMLWSFFVVSLPRVYAGYHYVSDIAAGASIGISSVLILEVAAVAKKIGVFVSKVEKQWTGLFYVAFFVLSYQTVTMFNDIREPVTYLFQHMWPLRVCPETSCRITKLSEHEAD
jgi:PAP2 superfamily